MDNNGSHNVNAATDVGIGIYDPGFFFMHATYNIYRNKINIKIKIFWYNPATMTHTKFT